MCRRSSNTLHTKLNIQPPLVWFKVSDQDEELIFQFTKSLHPQQLLHSRRSAASERSTITHGHLLCSTFIKSPENDSKQSNHTDLYTQQCSVAAFFIKSFFFIFFHSYCSHFSVHKADSLLRLLQNICLTCLFIWHQHRVYTNIMRKKTNSVNTHFRSRACTDQNSSTLRYLYMPGGELN